MSIEPPATVWRLPDAHFATPGQELLGIGADLEPGTMLAGYRHGLFPMHVTMPDDSEGLGWWSPNPRGVLRPSAVKVSRSLRRSARHFQVTIDQSFAEVVTACADPDRPHGWITPAFQSAYDRLFELGWAHSIEVWNSSTGELAGGLFGISIGGLFAAESKFHHQTDASKVAVWTLCEVMGSGSAGPSRLIDVQWPTEHLATLGVTELDRPDYLAELPAALELPAPDWSQHTLVRPKTGVESRNWPN